MIIVTCNNEMTLQLTMPKPVSFAYLYTIVYFPIWALFRPNRNPTNIRIYESYLIIAPNVDIAEHNACLSVVSPPKFGCRRHTHTHTHSHIMRNVCASHDITANAWKTTLGYIW